MGIPDTPLLSIMWSCHHVCKRTHQKVPRDWRSVRSGEGGGSRSKARRDEIVSAAAKLRSAHRAERSRLVEFIKIATERYGLRVFDNIDIEKLDDLPQKARIVANALMERGDARAYAMGRKMVIELDDRR